MAKWVSEIPTNKDKKEVWISENGEISNQSPKEANAKQQKQFIDSLISNPFPKKKTTAELKQEAINKTTIPHVDYDEDYLLDLIRSKKVDVAKENMQSAEKAYEEIKSNDDRTILEKAFDFVGGIDKVSAAKKDYKQAESEYENIILSQYYSKLPNGTVKTTNPQNKKYGSLDTSIDWYYEYINDINGTQTYVETKGKNSNGYSNLHKYSFMNEREKGIYNYLYENKGRKEAAKFLDFIENDLRNRETKEIVKESYEFSKNNPVLGSLKSVETKLASAGEHLVNSFDYAVTGNLNTNQAAMATSALRGAVTDATDVKIGNWDAFDFVYNTAMSGADSLVVAPLGTVGAVTLGLSAAASSTNDILERGGTNKQAFWGGIAAGVFEGFFEKFSISQLDSMQEGMVKGFKDYTKNVAKSMLTNASEETATEIANILYDYAANGGISQYALLVEEYMANGETEEKAKKKAAQKLGLQVLEAGASGALMGFGFGSLGSASAYKNYKNSPEYQKARTNSEILQMVDKVKKGDFKANDKVYLEAVTPEISKKIKEITGVDVSDFKVAIEARQIEHILKDHGAEGRADHSMADDVDIAKMEFTLSSPDSIINSGTTKAYVSSVNGKNKAANTVLYEKVLDENSYYVVQAVPDTKAKTLYIVSAFIGKSGYKKETSQTTDAKSPSATPNSENANVSSDINISQNDNDVNNNISTGAENNAQNQSNATTTLTEAEQKIVNTPDSQLTPEQRAVKQNIIERNSSVLNNGRTSGIINKNQEAGVESDVEERAVAPSVEEIRERYFTKDGTRRDTPETAETFAERTRRNSSKGSGKERTLLKLGKLSVAYTPSVSDTSLNRFVQKLNTIGIEAYCCEDIIETNVDGVTTIHDEAMTSSKGRIFFCESSKLANKEKADHELVHHSLQQLDESYLEYEDILINNLNRESNYYIAFCVELNEREFSNTYDIETTEGAAVFDAELAAYVYQNVLNDRSFADEFFSNMYNNWDEVVKAVYTFNSKMKIDTRELIEADPNGPANFMPENADLQSSAKENIDTDTESGRPTFREPSVREIYRNKTYEEQMNTIIGKGENTRQRQLKSVATKLGVNIRWSLNEERGYYDPETKTVVMNPKWTLTESYYVLFKHEFVHHLEMRNGYSGFKKYLINQSVAFESYIREKIKSVTGEEFKGSKEDALAFYTEIVMQERQSAESIPDRIRRGYNTEKIHREIIADFVGEVLLGGEDIARAEQALLEIAQTNRTLFQKIMDWLNEIISILKQESQNRTLVEDLEYLNSRLARVYDTAQKRSTDNTEKQFSFVRETRESKLANAETMEKEGATREEIWEKLGVIRDAAGNWVREINDRLLFYKNGDAVIRKDPDYEEFATLEKKSVRSEVEEKRYQELESYYVRKYMYGKDIVGNYVRADKLFKKYPELYFLKIGFENIEGEWGHYSPSEKKIVINKDSANNIFSIEAEGTLLHELQHAIQDIENRPSGSNIEYWSVRMSKGDKPLDENGRPLSPEMANHNTAGEIEARLNSDRNLLSDYMRKKNMPDFGWNRALFAQKSYGMVMDEMYTEAINSGDVAKAQSLIDEAARTNGYTERLYHQTGEVFTEFNTKNQNAGKYDWELPTGTYLKPTSEDIGLKGKKQMELYAKLENPLEFKNRKEAQTFWKKSVSGYANAVAKLEKLNTDYKQEYGRADSNVQQYLKEWREENPTTERREVYDELQFKMLYDKVQDIKEEWGKAEDRASLEAKKLIDNFIFDSDYDGIIVEHDQDGENHSTKSYIVFNSNQLKDAAPITYDDDGNVIPLSERFNIEKRDIRYSSLSTRNSAEFEKITADVKDGKISIDEFIEKLNKIAADEHKIGTELKTALEEQKKLHEDYVVDSARYMAQQKKRIKRQNEQLAKRRSEISQEITAQREERASKQKNIEHIRKTVNRIDKLFRANSNTKHIPEELKEATAYFVKMFADNDTSVFDKRDLQTVRTVYGDLADAETVITGYDEEIRQNIKALEKNISGKTLRELNYYETLLIRSIVDNFSQIINNENEMFIAGKQYEVDTIGNEALKELTDKKSKRENGIINAYDKSIKYSNMTPIYFFDRIGGVFKRLFDDVVRAQDKWYRNAENAKTYIRQIKEKYNYSKWDNDTFEFVTEKGDKINISREQALLLYATAKREYGNKFQRAEHLFRGGVVVPPNKRTLKGIMQKYKDSNSKGLAKITDAMTDEIDSKAHRIMPDDILKVFDWLTEEQRNYADAFVDYLSKDMSALGNEVSLQLYGITKYNEDYYIPYNSARNFLYSQPGVTNEARLKHQSFTKETVVGAKNPLILSDFSEVCADHINRMCMYNALTVPLENMNKILNFSKPSTEETDVSSVKAELERTYGKSAVDYINQFLLDMNGNVRTSETDKTVNKLISKFKKGAVFASASVVVQQPSAVMRAMAYIKPKYFRTTTLKLSERDYQQAVRYAAVAGIKEMGRFDTGVGAATTNWLLHQAPKGFKNKTKEFLSLKDSTYRDDKLSFFAAKADEMTWAHIWAATKAEIADTTNLKPGTEEFLVACGERFTEVINYTQVYDSTLARSQIMRDKSAGAQMLTAFMSEPTVSLNVLMNAVEKAKSGQKYGLKFATRAVGAFVGNVVLNAMLKSVITAGRDDDEEKTYLEKYLAALVGNIASDINPLALIPFVKDIISIFEGYTVERADMNLFSDLAQSIKILQSENKTTYEKIESIAGSLAAFLGLPVKNVLRDIRTAYNIADDFRKDIIEDSRDTDITGVKFAITDSSNSEIYEKLVKAAENDDEEEYQKIYMHLIDGGKTDANIKSGVKKVYRESKEVEKQTEKYIQKLQDNKTYEKLEEDDKEKLEKNISSVLATEKTVKATVNNSEKFNGLYEAYRTNKARYKKLRQELLDEGMSESNIDDGLEIARISYMKSQGINVQEYLLYKIAVSKKYADINGSGGVDKREKNKAISMLDLDEPAKQYLKTQHK